MINVKTYVEQVQT